MFYCRLFCWIYLFIPTYPYIPTNWPLKNTVSKETRHENPDKDPEEYNKEKYPSKYFKTVVIPSFILPVSHMRFNYLCHTEGSNRLQFGALLVKNIPVRGIFVIQKSRRAGFEGRRRGPFGPPSRDRGYLDFYERSEIKDLVTRDDSSPVLGASANY